MDDAFLEKILVGGQNLLHDIDRYTLSDFFLLVYVVHQIPMGTVLQHDVIMMRGFDYLVALHDIVVSQRLMDLDLAFEHV